MFVGRAAIDMLELERFVGPIASSHPLAARYTEIINPDLIVPF